MTGKELRESLRSGKRVYGTLVVSVSPKWIDIIDQLHLDFVFIDTEHIAINRHQLSWMCHAFRGKGPVPIVRIPSPDPYQACMVLDGGAGGIVAPYVESVEEVQLLRGAVKLRPLKGQKLNRYLQGREELEAELLAYLEENNDNNVLIVNIESRPAMDNLDEILKVPGLDAVLIGPHDLSCSLGIPEKYDHPTFLKAVETIITKARKANIGAGMHVIFSDGVEKEAAWAEMGANLLLHGADIISFARDMGKKIGNLRSILKDDVKREDSSINI